MIINKEKMFFISYIGDSRDESDWGFVWDVISKQKLDIILGGINSFDGDEFYFNPGKSLPFDSKEDLMNSFSFEEITKQEEKIISKFLPVKNKSFFDDLTDFDG